MSWEPCERLERLSALPRLEQFSLTRILEETPQKPFVTISYLPAFNDIQYFGGGGRGVEFNL